jgi:hypothetical protein
MGRIGFQLLLFARRIGEGVSKPSNPTRRPQFDLHGFVLNLKIITVEIASAVAFVWFVIHALMRELR